MKQKKSAIPMHEVFARRWAIPVLARMHGSGGAKLVMLTHGLDAPRASVKSSLELLMTLGLVEPNPGHGHPMRPEYILSDRGRLIADPSARLIRSIDRAHALDCALKRWSMPTLHAIGSGFDRFSSIATQLSMPTDRALSIAISGLQGASLIDRKIEDARPPRPRYSVARGAKRIVHLLSELDETLRQ